MVLADHLSWNIGPPNHFFRQTKISVTVQPRYEHGAGQKCPHGKIFEEFSVAIYVVVWIVASLKLWKLQVPMFLSNTAREHCNKLWTGKVCTHHSLVP